MRKDYIPDTNLIIYQDRSVFSYGTDSRLLLSFSRAKGKVLDLGAGTGVLSLGLAARNEVREVTAVEIQESLVKLLEKSIEENHLEDKVTVLHGDINDMDFAHGYYDAVITNPPYFTENDGEAKHLEKHVIAKKEVLSLETWIRCGAKALKYGGTWEMVHRPSRLVDVVLAMRNCHIEPKTIEFFSSGDQPAKLMLVRGKKGGKPGVKILHRK